MAERVHGYATHFQIFTTQIVFCDQRLHLIAHQAEEQVRGPYTILVQARGLLLGEVDDAAGALRINWQSLASNLAIARSVVPAVANIRLLRAWPAVVNGTADWKPVLGELPGVPGFLMTVFPWLGFSAGPIVARITANLLLGRDPGFDLSPFSAARYMARA